MESMRGKLERVQYHKDRFLIGKLADGSTVKGYCPYPDVGLEYVFRGTWTQHAQFGLQFQFESYEILYPTSGQGLVDYLSTHLKGIGPHRARQILDTFGERSLEVLRSAPDELVAAVPGISAEQAQEISRALQAREESARIEVELRNLFAGIQVGGRVLSRIIEKYGADAATVVRKHPYSLITEIRGIGFLTADRVARASGLPEDGKERLRAGIVHALRESANDGHCCLPLPTLIRYVAEELLHVETYCVLRELDQFAMEPDGPVRFEDRYVYLSELMEAEAFVARAIHLLLHHPARLDALPVSMEGLHEDQAEALRKAVESNVFILTGAPGTGKTWAITRILKSLDGQRVALAAPTGKAAKRITEQTGASASTIHRLLEPEVSNDGEFSFRRNEQHQLEIDALIIDEASMVDVRLMASLLRAVSLGTRVVLVGDAYQLPSVGPGNVLRDLIEAKIVPSTELTIIKRQNPGLIITNCHRVKEGREIEVENQSPDSDFYFLEMSDTDAIARKVLEFALIRLPGKYGLHPLRDIQVISPRRAVVSLSCEILNERIQETMNRSESFPGTKFRVGDKVIQTSNNYDLGLMNGDVGFIAAINPGRSPSRALGVEMLARSLLVAFEDPARNVVIPISENSLELAYALTVHKTQGSQWPAIVMPISRVHGSLVLQRNLIYTAISRAQKVCVCIGERAELLKAIRRTSNLTRWTRLAERVKRGTPCQ